MDFFREHARRSMARQPIAINVVLTLLSRVLPFIVAVVAIPITIRGLGVDRFGALALVWALLAQLTFFDFGLGKACTALVAAAAGRGEAARAAPIVWNAFRLQTALGLLGALTLYWAAPALVGALAVDADLAVEALSAFRIAGASLPFLVAGLALRGGLEGMQRFGAVSAIETMAKSALLVIPAAGALRGWDLPAICRALVVAQALTLSAYFLASLRLFPGFSNAWRFSGLEVRSLMRFGKWVAVSSFVGPIMIFLDRWVIASALGVTAVAYYTTPFEIVFRLSVISQSVIAALFPALSTLYAMKLAESAARAADVATKFVVVVVGLIGSAMILLSSDILMLWLGPDFARESSVVLQILTVGFVINSAARIPYATVQAVGRPDVTGKLHLVELPVYLAMLGSFISAWGLVGAAIAWTVRVALDGVLLFVAQRRLTGSGAADGGDVHVLRGGVLVGVCALMAAACALTAPTLVLRVSLTAAMLGIAILVAHRLVLDRDEREMLRDLVSRGLAVVAR